jgi:hypothetical protein
MAVKYSKWTKICQHFPFQGLLKCIQIGFFGQKINNLATLPRGGGGGRLENGESRKLQRQSKISANPGRTTICEVDTKQGCQMVCFETENPNLGKFWRVMQ